MINIDTKYFYGSLFLCFYIIYLYGHHHVIIKNNNNKCFGLQCAHFLKKNL